MKIPIFPGKYHQTRGFSDQNEKAPRLSRPKAPQEVPLRLPFFLGHVGFWVEDFISFFGGEGKVFLHPLCELKTHPPTHWHEFHFHLQITSTKNLQEKHLMYRYIYPKFSININHSWIGTYTIVAWILWVTVISDAPCREYLPTLSMEFPGSLSRW